MNKQKENYLSYVLMYLSYFGAYALLTVLTSVYLTDKGYTSVDISIVVSSGLLASMIISTLVGYFSDRYGTKYINMILLILSALSGVLYLMVNTLWLTVLTYSLAFCLMNVVNPSIEKLATMSRFRYGNIRVWGTIGFSLGTQFSGIIYRSFGSVALFSAFAIAMGVSAISLLFIPGIKGVRKATIQDTDIDQSDYHVKKVFRQSNFILYIIICSIFYAGANVSSTYLPNMLKFDGLDITQVSTVLSLAVVAEIPMILFSHKFMDKLDSKMLMKIFLFAMFTQYAVYAFVPIVLLKIILTILCKHIMGMIFIMTNLKVIRMIIPKHSQMTALAIVSTINSISAVFLQNIMGVLLSVSNYSMFYVLLTVLMLLAILLLHRLNIVEDKKIKLFH